jgi:hypothetical protein
MVQFEKMDDLKLAILLEPPAAFSTRGQKASRVSG